MDLEQLDVLERRITEAVSYLEKLKGENQELRRENQELRAEMQSKELRAQQLAEENENLRQLQNESVMGKEKEERIKSKVELMLSKLDELEFSI